MENVRLGVSSGLKMLQAMQLFILYEQTRSAFLTLLR